MKLDSACQSVIVFLVLLLILRPRKVRKGVKEHFWGSNRQTNRNNVTFSTTNIKNTMVENVTNASNEYSQNITVSNQLELKDADIVCNGPLVQQTASAQVQADQSISTQTVQEFENAIDTAVQGEIDQQASQQTTTAGGAIQTSQNEITNETNFLNEIENVQNEYYAARSDLANRIEGALKAENFMEVSGVRIDPCDKAGHERLMALPGLSDDVKLALTEALLQRELDTSDDKPFGCNTCPLMTQEAKIELIIEQGLSTVLDTFSTTTSDTTGIVDISQKSESENKDLNLDFGFGAVIIVLGIVMVMMAMGGMGGGEKNN